MKIRTRLISGFLAVALLAGLLGFNALSATKDIGEALEKLNEVDIPAINSLHIIHDSIHHTTLAAMEYASTGDEKFMEDYRRSKIEYEAALSRYIEAEVGEEEFIEELSRSAGEIMALSLELMELKDSGSSEDVLLEKITAMNKAHDGAKSLLYKEIAHDNAELAQSQLIIQEKITNALYGIILASILVILFALALGYYFSRSISKPILELRETAEEVSKGDLSVEIRGGSQDEIGELATSFQYMVEELRKLRDGLKGDVRKQTRELMTTLDYLNRLIDTSPIAIITTDLGGRIMSFSKHAEEVYGYKAGEVIGKHAKILQPPDIPEETGEKVVDVILKGRVWEGDILQRRKNGEVFPAYLRARRLLDEKGEPIGMMGLALDITDRKKAQEQLEAYARQLEESNRLKDLFTDIMRHDLLNPVSVIKGVSRLSAEDAKGKTEKDFNIIARNAEKLEDLIETAAKLSKIESRKKIFFVNADLNEFIQSAINGLKPALEEKKMKLEYGAKGEYPLRASPVLEEVFYNLISNAIKYSPPGTKITVDVEDEGGHWLVSVKDEGEGVPEEYKKAIFERFERGDKRGVKGSGLGLAIVKRIVDLHLGKVWVEDNPGGGSIFRLRLPKQS